MTAPRGNSSDSHLNQLLAALAQYIDTATVPVPLTTTTILRVDTAGNDGTAVPGRFDLPYATIGGAIAAAVSGDTILIGPGTFPNATAITNTLLSLYIVGSGMYSTIISSVAAGNCLQWTGAATLLARLCISNLSLVAGAGQGLVVNANAAGAVGSFDDTANGRNGLILDHVYMSSTGVTAATFTAVNNIVMRDCVGLADAFTFNLCSRVNCFDCAMGATTFTFPVDATPPSLGIRAKNLAGCILASLTVATSDNVICDADCIVAGNITTTVDDTDAGVLPTSLEFHGTCIGNMVLGHTFALGARVLAFLCDRCKLAGTLAVAGLGVSRATAVFRNAVLYTAGAGNISTGAVSDLDLIGAQFDHTITTLVAVADGTCNRSYFSSIVAAPGAGANVYNFAAVGSVPYTDANYSVIIETIIAGEDPIVTHKAVDHLDFTVVAGGAATTVTVLHE